MSGMARREELINGERVRVPPRPSFNHNRVGFNISLLLERYLEGTEYVAVVDGSDLYLSEDNRFVPDVMVVRGREQIRPDGVHGAPVLVVEILTPRTARRVRGLKRAVYGHCGVKEYWVVDPVDKSVEVYHDQDGDLALRERHTLYPDWRLEKMPEKSRACVVTHFKCGVFEDLDISLKEIFYRTF